MAGGPRRPTVVLTVAGSDSGGGAGIQADLRTFAAHGVFGATALTSITAQNTRGVQSIHDLPPGFVAEQMRSVLDDLAPAAAKTGMLSSAGIVEAVAALFREFGTPNLVVDPVMIAKSGDALLKPEAREALRSRLIPLARVVTPNLPEAGELAGHEVTDRHGMEAAARAILGMGPGAVLVKGGHLEGGEVADLLLEPDGEPLWFVSERIDTPHSHGTGCTLSAALAARLAVGDGLAEAVEGAREWLAEALRIPLLAGGGIGCPDHLHRR
jgi:hydroxymethylpyrimidine/phosphomethylpyrimidine kinase